MKKSTDYLDEVVLHLGMTPYGSIRKLDTIPKTVKPQQVRKFLRIFNLTQEKHQPSLRQLNNFLVQQLLATTFPKDQSYFENHH